LALSVNPGLWKVDLAQLEDSDVSTPISDYGRVINSLATPNHLERERLSRRSYVAFTRGERVELFCIVHCGSYHTKHTIIWTKPLIEDRPYLTITFEKGVLVNMAPSVCGNFLYIVVASVEKRFEDLTKSVKIVRGVSDEICNSWIVFPEYPKANFILYKFELAKEIVTAKFIKQQIDIIELTTVGNNLEHDLNDIFFQVLIPLTITKNFIHFFIGKNSYFLPIDICLDDALPYELVLDDEPISQTALVFVNDFEYLVMIGKNCSKRITVLRCNIFYNKNSLTSEVTSTTKANSSKKLISRRRYITNIVMRRIYCPPVKDFLSRETL
jgi:hypothetical protein